jgi:hypothetical protein
MKELNLNMATLNGNEIIYRSGSAAPIELPEVILISGDINTISSFVTKRYNTALPDEHGLQKIDPNKIVVKVDKENFEICLDLDPQNPRGATVTGKLSMAPELLKFSINTGKAFTREELVKLIRFNKIWFASRDQADSLEKAYMSFNAEIHANIGKESDNRGNVNNSYKKTVSTNIPESFALNVPVFKGQEKRQFHVDILIEATDASTRFYLESVALHDLITIESDQILNNQLECCKEFVIVYK